jgi:hypothetical protein
MLDDVWDWGPRRPTENDLRYLSFDHREDGGVFNYHVLSLQIYSPCKALTSMHFIYIFTAPSILHDLSVQCP